LRSISLHDTRTGGVRALKPEQPGRVRIYACGPTVYGRIHVGNARPFVVFSLLKRFLVHEGHQVTFVANITDVNDKIYAAARALGVGSTQLAAEMTAAYRAELAARGWPLSELEEAALTPVYHAFRVGMAAAEMEDGLVTGDYDLAMIERQLSRTATAAPSSPDLGHY